MGRLTKAPELRYTASNTAVCSFTLAVNRRFAKQGEERQADFINCQAWQKTAEFISKYFDKGSMISIVGRIQTRTWDDNEGKRHYATEVIAEEVYFTGEKRSEHNGNADYSHGDAYEPAVDGSEDDLPF